MAKHRENQQAPCASAADGAETAVLQRPDAPDPQPNGNPDHPAQPSTTITRRKKRREAIPPGETKEQRFARLAPRRVKAAVKRIAQVANLAKRASYEHSPTQKEWVLAKIVSAVNELIAAFGDGPAKEEECQMPA